jgi:hypothetical protein
LMDSLRSRQASSRTDQVRRGNQAERALGKAAESRGEMGVG